jgi:glc operon protein GlcG
MQNPSLWQLNNRTMYSLEKVSFKEAIQLVQQAVSEAEKLGKHIAIAISGPEGEAISFLRMDEAAPASALIAQNKAYTAARDRKSTKEMGQFMNDKNRPPAFWGDPGITGFAGGVPIVLDGRVIGGIGISGLSEEEDERIARAAIKAVYGA